MAQPPQYVDADFLAGMQALLPTGPAWPRDPDAVVTQVLAALVPLYTANAAAASGLLADAFPVSPVNLLPEWQATLGLPDPCAGQNPTLQAEQEQVATRFVATGGQSIPYFVSVAATLGFPITITQFRPFRFGDSFGQLLYGEPWAFAWQVNAPPLGNGSSGNNVLVCELQRIAPAHTVPIFQFAAAFRVGVSAIGSTDEIA
jgi:uncharacterized protein YmfQ (DUF2313 family)